MFTQAPVDLSKFSIVGINYKKTDVSVRGRYAIGKEQYANLFSLAAGFNIKEFFVLSTCNRTEIYGFANNSSELGELLCTQTEGGIEFFNSIAYTKSGRNAVEHLFSVAAGLDSQILGDYEIIGQIKQAVRFSKEHKCIGSYLERLSNGVLQSSKEIRNTTRLSEGTVSVSFAAIQFIKEYTPTIDDQKILLIGTGKIGRNTCRNLVDYLKTKKITLINRTIEKAAVLADELGLAVASMEQLTEQIQLANIILVATDANEPVILKSQLVGTSNKLIIDLSVPYNVEKEAESLPGITVINVDQLAKVKDATLQIRMAEVPKAKAIIEKHIGEFTNWHAGRSHVRLIKAVKTKLEQMHNCNLYISYSSKHASASAKDPVRIQKVINGMAVKIREQNRQGCHFIEAINEYIATGTN
jgi:glutamyl-tRNA reductase